MASALRHKVLTEAILSAEAVALRLEQVVSDILVSAAMPVPDLRRLAGDARR